MKSVSQEARVILKSKRDKPVRAFHPWIYSGAIDQVDSALTPGSVVRVYSSENEFLGVGYFNPRSQITVRMLTFQEESIDVSFFSKRFETAERLRLDLIPAHTNAYRCVHSEGDFLPGLIVDRYGDYLVSQFLTAGMEALKPVVAKALEDVFHPKGIYERSDVSQRKLEGLPEHKGLVSGEEPPEKFEVEECGNRFVVDIRGGQKTGLFLDQRENRGLVARCAKGKRVLDGCAYAGGFSISLARAGAAAVTAVETQSRAFERLKENFELNGLAGERYRCIQNDIFEFLRRDKDTYDLIVLDPPAFCKSKNQVQQAARGYKDINLNAVKRLAPGGLIFTSSCSSFIDPELFQKIVFGAAKDAGREVQILAKTAHSIDHPVSLYHPEGAYLKGLLLRVF